MTTDPILLDLPMPIRTPRLIITPVYPEKRDEYAEKTVHAIDESMAELGQWMLWANHKNDSDEAKTRYTNWYAKFLRREEMCLVALTHDGEFVAATGIHEINWKIPRGAIGYWCRTSKTGQGYITEIANALTRYAFEVMQFRKITIEVDSDNIRSVAVAKRLGFRHEYDDLGGIRKPGATELRTRSVYSRFDLDGLPPLEVSW